MDTMLKSPVGGHELKHPKPPRVLRLGWMTTVDAIDALAFSVEKLEPKLIVGVARGGLIPATMLSHKLGVKMEVIKASAYEGTRRTLHKPIEVSSWEAHFNTKDTVIIDDILDTGATLEAIKNLVRPGEVRFNFATVMTKRCVDGIYFGRVAPDVWVKFPWEGNET